MMWPSTKYMAVFVLIAEAFEFQHIIAMNGNYGGSNDAVDLESCRASFFVGICEVRFRYGSVVRP